MRINIFDVEHGNCALVQSPTGNLSLIDCGHNSSTGFRPSYFLRNNYGLGTNRRLAQLIISNVDQDHLSDLVNVRSLLNPQVLSRNPLLHRPFVENIKEEMTPELNEYVSMHEYYNAPAPALDWGGVTFDQFYHDTDLFDDTNNLSIVTFVTFGQFKIVFPGDLEIAGWKQFLTNRQFIDHLRLTNVFVASHHGRETGYCKEVFDHCRPDIVLISDESIKYDTQRDVGYANHSKGITFSDNILRKVLTTRNNGMITVDAATSPFTVSIERA